MRNRSAPATAVAPWFGRGDYGAHRALDWTLPDTFEEWQQRAEARAGPPRGTKRVLIQSGEFSRWCIGEGRTPNAAARIAFAAKAASRVLPSR